MFGGPEKKIMKIDVRIPYGENRRLARAYNQAILESTTNWVLFLDHDVFLCNPCWYDMCVEAIRSLYKDPLAASIGCVAGGERHASSMEKSGPPPDGIEFHIQRAMDYYHKYGTTVERIQEHTPGFFMLLNREIAKRIKFFQQKPGINNIDKDFGKRLLQEGYHIYNMPGLYVYHRRGMKHLKKEFKIKDG